MLQQHSQVKSAAYRQFTNLLVFDHDTSHVTRRIQNNTLRQKRMLISHLVKFHLID